MNTEHVDVLIVGAGLSGIGAGYHLQVHCPDKRYLILEARESSGGTWDLFRYPGIRSDSDMHTLGYSFQPWVNAKAIADGASILDYVRSTAREYGIDQHIRYRHRVRSASWSSAEAAWTVDVERGPDAALLRFTCHFLFMCSGYYDYSEGYTPPFAGLERYRGRIVHPQQWTGDIDCKGKQVIVIGSGATAVTLVPEIAKEAAHVTMLQRSPTYMVGRPEEDQLANLFRRWLPRRAAYGLTRWKNVLLGMFFYNLCRKRPQRVREMLFKQLQKDLPGYDIAKHFNPQYNPWDQRMCLVRNGDLFKTLNAGTTSIVTDHIETFTENGIRLRSGEELAADVVVTATGLKLLVLGGLQLSVDGNAVEINKTMSYKGMMYSDVPNFASAFGYTNASWTLKCDLTCEYVCRLLNHMTRVGKRQVTPRRTDPSVEEQPWLDFTSGYVQRSLHLFPKQGSKAPWRLYQNYALDILSLRYRKLEDGVLEFSNPAVATTSMPERLAS